MDAIDFGRRSFLVGAGAAIAVGGPAWARTRIEPGIYPIAWTPCTADGRLDPALLRAQADFCESGRVRGIVWPQLASAWDTLTEEEWQAGAAALAGHAGQRHLKIVLGVQAPGGDVDHAIQRARTALRLGADAIISLPPTGKEHGAILAYYKALGAATPLPLMMQAVGDMGVDLVSELARQVPTLAAIKDEAADPLKRAPQILSGTSLEDFSGGGGRTLLAEMESGFSGSCPYVGLSDLFQRSFDLWKAGDRSRAFEMFGRILAFDSLPGANEYVLTVRGVFHEDTVLRRSGNAAPKIIEPAEKQLIRDSFHRYLDAYRRA
jgi:dihydrodipicolinate synthase/N-acetylneuraminate lyase